MKSIRKYILLPLSLASAACNSGQEIISTEVREPVARVVEYTPAPGQFINEPKSGYDNVTSEAKAVAYAERRMSTGEYVSLGAWGGYIVAAFDKPVPATGGYDLYVVGNAMPTSSEPGVVWVMQDSNGNGIPDDDAWYQIKGSEFAKSVQTYRITYYRPAGSGEAVRWTDNAGKEGAVGRIGDHTQESYFPLWITGETAVFEGVLLPENVGEEGEVEGSAAWIPRAFDFGYADNYGTDATGVLNRFRISDAVTSEGFPARLTQIDFIKVQTGVNAWRTRIGEISTEVCGMGCYRTVTKQ